MLKDSKAFSGFSVDDLQKAKEFYGQTLGLEVNETPEGLGLNFKGGGQVFIYSKPDHAPASFTILNFQVDKIDEAVEELSQRGVSFERYGGDMEQDTKGIFRGAESGQGPNIAWFTDPAGNVLSVLEGDGQS